MTSQIQCLALFHISWKSPLLYCARGLVTQSRSAGPDTAVKGALVTLNLTYKCIVDAYAECCSVSFLERSHFSNSTFSCAVW